MVFPMSIEKANEYQPKFFEEKIKELPLKWRKALQKVLLLRNISNPNTKAQYLQTVLSFYRITKVKEPEKVTREDVEKWVAKIREEMAEWSFASYAGKFKTFMKTYFETKDYPPSVAWIKPPSKSVLIKKNNKMRDKILTEEEIKKLVETARDIKVKTFIMMTWEGALRLGEVLNLRIRDLEFTRYGVKVRILGKTGERTILLFKSQPYIKQWLQVHPFRNDPNAYLFVSLWGGKWRQVRPESYKNYLARLAQKAGIKKRVHPHMLRHTRLTELAKVLTEQELKIFAGWEPDSTMASIYVHLSGRDVEKALLEKVAGVKIEEEEEKKPSKLEPKICPRCGWENVPEALYCSGCGLVLDEKMAFKIREKEEEKTETIEKLEKALKKLAKEKPEVIKELLKAMES